jgi:hypothetical protein
MIFIKLKAYSLIIGIFHNSLQKLTYINTTSALSIIAVPLDGAILKSILNNDNISHMLVLLQLYLIPCIKYEQ